METYNSRDLHKTPFTINNQVYILGNAVINAQTLEQLVYALDQVGSTQPIVIINPQANTIPDFSQKLSNLIQNNRRTQPDNVTSADKYRFMNMSDAEIEVLIESTCKNNPTLSSDMLRTMYQGLRVRARLLYELDTLSKERDALWAAHCANPSSTDGSARFSELNYVLIPQKQAEYDSVSKQLQSIQVTQNTENNNVAAQRSVSNTIQHTQQETAKQENIPSPAPQPIQKPEPVQKPEPGLTDITTDFEGTIWGPWLDPKYLKMPLSTAKELATSANYRGFAEQQRDVSYQGQSYKAVPLCYLLVLGIPLFSDGIPVCFTDTGKFVRVGTGTQLGSNLAYWYPQPKEF